jgi:hypothetical protein
MKLTMLLVIGAVTPSFVICSLAISAERHSDMVVAQAQPAATGKDKDKDKDKGKPKQQQQQL